MITQSFDSKIPCVIFLRDYLLACEISTVRLALKRGILSSMCPHVACNLHNVNVSL